jgi:molybdopterin synthase catalytic subunit
MIRLAERTIDPAGLLRQFTAAVAGAGAILSFTGVVRGQGDVRDLWLDHHERLTLGAISALAAEACERFELADVAVVHRVGRILAGEPILFVAAAAVHRRAAFDAVDFMMDRLKSQIPLWKRETRGDREVWIEPRAQDLADLARWDQPRG